MISLDKIRELVHYKEMLKNLTLYDLRTRYKGSIIGFLWTFLNPLLLLGVYYLVFSTVMRIDIDYYFLYMFIGLLPWMMFQSSLQVGVSSIITNSNLIKKIYFPREVIPLSTLFSGVVNYLFGMIILIPFLFILDLNVLQVLIWLPVALVTQSLFTLGLLFLFSSLNVFFRDMEHIISVVMMAWFYFTPIIYPSSMIPPKYEYLFNLNPLKYYIDFFHNILYYNAAPNSRDLMICIITGLAVLVFGWLVFHKLEKKFAEEI